ncbi:MAG: hypothetical protein KDK39_12305 [Leptospiraceae bacterium]|nr:hypothetical protein [Leptospiraceae bacterium]
MDKNTLAIVRESYGRCAMQATFFEDFYETFMRSSPEIMPFFDKTNMAKQRQLLREGISFMILFADNNAGGEMAIEHIGKIHDVKHVNVRPELYPLWINSLLECIGKHDKHHNEEIRDAWKAVLDIGIRRFIAMYRPQKAESEAAVENESAAAQTEEQAAS